MTDASYFIVYRICIISCFSVSQYDWMSNDSFFILFPFAIVWYFVLYIDSVASLLLRGIGVSVQICLFCIDILSNWIVLFVGWEPHRSNRFCHGHYLQAYLSKYKCKSVVYSVWLALQNGDGNIIQPQTAYKLQKLIFFRNLIFVWSHKGTRERKDNQKEFTIHSIHMEHIVHFFHFMMLERNSFTSGIFYLQLIAYWHE